MQCQIWKLKVHLLFLCRMISLVAFCRPSNEKAIVESISGDLAPALKVGDVVVEIDTRYYRPTEVETLLGDAAKAKDQLGWVPEITVEAMCKEMMHDDLLESKKQSLLKSHGYAVNVSHESH